MSRTENPYTKRATENRIKAVLAAGLRVVEVRQDGTILVEERDNASSAGNVRLTGQPKLRDARKKLLR
jgi:hypothetical protein